MLIKKICEKCGKEFEVEDTYEKRKRRFCSRSCANGHKHSEETKQKISNSLRKIKQEENIKQIPLTDDTMCSYGCGNRAKYKFKNGKFCCEKTVVQCPAMKIKLKENHVDSKEVYKRLPIEKKLKMASSNKNKQVPLEDFLNRNFCSNTSLKTYILRHNLIEYKCSKCGITEWNGHLLHLQLHHKDGNHQNNVLENLTFLCPNCHSQTENFCKKQYREVTEEELKEAYIKAGTRGGALKFLGLRMSGHNYYRLDSIIKKFNL